MMKNQIIQKIQIIQKNQTNQSRPKGNTVIVNLRMVHWNCQDILARRPNFLCQQSWMTKK